MGSGNAGLVDVFPVSTGAWGIPPDWFDRFTPRLVQPSYMLMALFLVVAIGIMALKRFEHADLEKKLWNLPVILVIVIFWPSVILGIKGLVDAFDTFLVHEVFQISWAGFGFPDFTDGIGISTWSAQAFAFILPNLAYWIIYGFYLVFLFFYAVVGPLILAKGILFDEIEAFLALVKEIILLFLWQTTAVVLICFILPDIVSGRPFPSGAATNPFYFRSIILGVMLFFTPSLARKFGNHLGSGFFTSGFKWGGAALGMAMFAKAGAAVSGAIGFPIHPSHRFEMWKERGERAEEFQARHHHASHIEHLSHEKHLLEHQLHAEEHAAHHHAAHDGGDHHAEHEEDSHGSLLDLSKRAHAEHHHDAGAEEGHHA